MGFQLINVSAGSASYYRTEIEFGWHPLGKHESLVLGVKQVLITTSPDVAGATIARIGGEYGIPLAEGKFELTICGYGAVGALYGGFQPNAFLYSGGGAEVKFFFWQGLYAFGRPVEAGGIINDPGNAFVYSFAGGAGYAF